MESQDMKIWKTFNEVNTWKKKYWTFEEIIVVVEEIDPVLNICVDLSLPSTLQPSWGK